MTVMAGSRRVVLGLIAGSLVPALAAGQSGSGSAWLRDLSWSPSGARIAVSYIDRIWTLDPDGKNPRSVTGSDPGVERDPVWSPDGRTIAFAADRGLGFDIYVVSADGGRADRVTPLTGDERWPSWTSDGRLVFAHRRPAPNGVGADPSGQWDLYIATRTGESWRSPESLTDTPDDEMEPRVSPDGSRIVFVSDRESEGDTDLWVMPLTTAGAVRATRAAAESSVVARPQRPVRLTNVRGIESAPTWAPQGDRVAFYAIREGLGSIWVVPVAPPAAEGGSQPGPRLRPAATLALASRKSGQPAWSPDGKTLLVSELPDPDPTYNGNPLRSTAEAPPLFGMAQAFRLWSVPAPVPIDDGAVAVPITLAPPDGTFGAAFDRVWQTLKDLYYQSGPGAERWTALRDRYRPRAAAARDANALEAIVDEMVGEQPLINPVVTTSGAVVVSGHPLASEAGRLALEKGGNIVDAAIAVSFALGVVEPEASGIGGDGMAVLYLKGMNRPTVIDYKDQTPIRATPDNPKLLREGRMVSDGPSAANIPGVVAGLDLLYKSYASKKVTWSDLIAPAIRYADSGFVLNSALPTSIAEGRSFLTKYAEASRVYLPGGKVPRPGDRFSNKDYANTLRVIATEGADAFYRGSIARQIAADMEANGGIITLADLAQYRAIEREPVVGHYRGHTLYAGGPPVSTGISLFESLQILENFRPVAGARAARDADYLHYLVESWKVRDAVRRVADPERWPVEFAEHLTRQHALERFKRIDPKKASRYERTDDEQPGTPARIGTGTTSFVVADFEGNMIAVTQTLSTWGGTFYVSKNLGFLYNNHLRGGRGGGTGYGAMVPLMRSSSTSVPTLVFTDGRTPEPRLAVGAAGNAWIPASVYSIITAVIDGGMGAQEAVEAPRFLVGRDPTDPQDATARIQIEDRFPVTMLQDLMARGHRFQKIGRKGEVRYGYASAALVDVRRRTVEGGAEPRRSHAAVGLENTRR